MDGKKNLIMRSKFEHTPRLLVNVKYSDENFFIGELDKYINFNTNMDDDKIRDINDGKLDLSNLVDVPKKHINKIESINIKKDRRLNPEEWHMPKLNITEV